MQEVASKSFGLIFFLFLLTSHACKKSDTLPPEAETEEDAATTAIPADDTIRLASFNVSMFRTGDGQLTAQMGNGNNSQAQTIAEIIQRVRPDVLAVMEFDYVEHDVALNGFRNNYLAVPQKENLTGIEYPYRCAVVSNTGVLSTADFDGDGSINRPNDAYGFGNFPGQYAFSILSKYPLDLENSRSFREFLWKDMPDAALPEQSDGESWYSEAALEEFRLSSKNHIDIPVILPNGQTIHALLAHPTPPVFDGTEDRNGKRNHDEIRLWADYIDNADYLVDDKGVSGGLAAGSSFAIFGDMNADPFDGDSYENAITQLVNHPKINSASATGALIPSSVGGAEHNQICGDAGEPEHDTSFFGLRVDYVLTSNDLNVVNSGVFWPSSTDSLAYLTSNLASSDHLMVWVDLMIEN